jgi:hypothetical protein
MGFNTVDLLVLIDDLAFFGLYGAGYGPQKSAFSGTIGTNQNHDFAIVYINTYPIDRQNTAVSG